MNHHYADVRVVNETHPMAPAGIWYVVDHLFKKHFFSSRELAIKYAARLRFDLMNGQVQ